MLISNVCFVHESLVHFPEDDWDFSNNFSHAFAVDLLVHYLHDEDLLPLENTGFWWVIFTGQPLVRVVFFTLIYLDDQ